MVANDFLALYLSATEEFDDHAQVLEILERFEQDCAGLEEALSRLWGPAESVGDYDWNGELYGDRRV